MFLTVKVLQLIIDKHYADLWAKHGKAIEESQHPPCRYSSATPEQNKPNYKDQKWLQLSPAGNMTTTMFLTPYEGALSQFTVQEVYSCCAIMLAHSFSFGRYPFYGDFVLDLLKLYAQTTHYTKIQINLTDQQKYFIDTLTKAGIKPIDRFKSLRTHNMINVFLFAV